MGITPPPPPKKSKIGGPNLRGGGPWHAGIAKCFKNEDFFAENCGNFWKKLFCERFRELLFSKKITSTTLSPTFSGKNFCFPEIFFYLVGALEWKGAQIWEYTPPQPETGLHGTDRK